MTNNQQVVMPDRRALMDRLARQEGLGEVAASSLAARLVLLEGDLREAFIAWWHTGTVPSLPPVFGYDLRRLKEERHQKSLASAFSIMAHLRTLTEVEAKRYLSLPVHVEFTEEESRAIEPYLKLRK